MSWKRATTGTYPRARCPLLGKHLDCSHAPIQDVHLRSDTKAGEIENTAQCPSAHLLRQERDQSVRKQHIFHADTQSWTSWLGVFVRWRRYVDISRSNKQEWFTDKRTKTSQPDRQMRPPGGSLTGLATNTNIRAKKQASRGLFGQKLRHKKRKKNGLSAG